MSIPDPPKTGPLSIGPMTRGRSGLEVGSDLAVLVVAMANAHDRCPGSVLKIYAAAISAYAAVAGLVAIAHLRVLVSGR